MLLEPENNPSLAFSVQKPVVAMLQTIMSKTLT